MTTNRAHERPENRSREALILFAHGSRDPGWAAPFERVAQRVSAGDVADTSVRLAYLEFASPTLPSAVAAAVAEGASRVRVLPLFMAAGAHLRRDLPALVAEARTRAPGVQIDVLPAIGDDARLWDVVERIVLEALCG